MAQSLGVSNKTISKWETGKCMPDYSIIKSLCEELGKQKNVINGVMLIVMGIALQALSYNVGGSVFRDIISGFLLGFAIIDMLVDVSVVALISVMTEHLLCYN